jgi:transposase
MFQDDWAKRHAGCGSADMRAYSLDLRERIVRAVDQGRSQREAARLFGVGVSSVKRYLQQRTRTGQLARRPIPGGPRKIHREQEAVLRARVQEAPAATLAELAAWWLATQGQHLSVPTLSRALKRLGLTRKKGRWGLANATRRRETPGGSR